MEERTLLSGTISGLVFEDYNANGAYDTNSTIPNASQGTIGVAVDRGLGGVTVTAYDGAGAVRGTATTAATGAYNLAATGTGPYRVVFTNLPAGTTEGRRGPDSKTSVQFVPDGNSTNVSLGVSFPNDFSVNNPLVATNQYIYGDALAGPYSSSPTIVGFTYSAGSQYGGSGDYGQPAAFPFSVPVSEVGTTFGLGYSPATGSLYASSFTKRFAGYGPNAAGTATTNGAVYAVNPASGTASVLADLNTIFGANTAGVDFRTQPGWAGYTTDGGNAGWDAVGKTSLGGLDVSPDGSTVYVTNLADRRFYAIPTSGPINASTVRRVSIPFNAPGATGTAGGTQAGDLRPFAVTYYRGRIYVGVVNSAESTQNVADLRAYVYSVDPTTLAFSAAPVFQASLNYTRGLSSSFGGSGNPSAEWNPWSTTFRTEGAGTTAAYAQPMLTGLAFDAAGNMVLGLRDRSGDQTGFFTNANPANPGQTYEGIAGGDTLMAFINTPFNLNSGWTLENNGRGPAGQGAGPQNTNLGPGGASFYYQQSYINGTHSNVASGGVYIVPGFNDVISSTFDPGTTTVRTGGVRFFNTVTGATDKGYQIYNTGFNAPPQSTFGKASGIGDVVALQAPAPIEIGDRVFRDSDGDGIQDPGEAGIAGVTVRLYMGNTLVGTAVTDATGGYLFNDANVSNGLMPNTAYQIRFDNGSDFAVGGPLAGLLPTIPNADPSGLAGSRVVLNGTGVPIINKTTGGAGVNDHTLDAGFIATARVAGTAFVDANNDGIRQGGEVPLAGVTLTLTGTDDLGNAVSLTTTTAADGSFAFAGIRPSNGAGYTIAESLPAGYLGGRSTPGNLGGTNTPPSGVIQGIVVAQGANGTGYAFGNLAPASLRGFAYVDANNDGIKQASDPGIAGVTVTLTGTNDVGQAVNLTTTTLGDGSYAFTNLRPSNGAGYTITETQPAAFLDGKDTVGTPGGTVGADAFTAVVLAPGINGVNNNFGELVPASLAGRVYFDSNNDGIKQGPEPGIAGVTVTLTGTNDLGQTVNLTATTAADGSYAFTNLRPSSGAGYTITETQPAGFLDGRDTIGTPGGTAGNDVFSGIVLLSGVNGVTNDFGELVPSRIAGFVYVDSSNDGIKQASEAGIAGVTVTLTGTNDLGQTVNLTATTAADGSYAFTNLRPSNAAGYTITETQPAGFLDGKDTVGTPGGTVGADTFTAIVLGPNVNGVNNNFGELQAASLSGSVFVDANNDGRRQAAETGIPGVTVTLTGTNDLGQQVNVAATTAADGTYTFTGLRPGNYTLTNTPPPQYTVGKNSVGTAGGTVNGPNSITQIALTSGTAAAQYFFGETGATVSGLVFVDLNRNGLKNLNESGLGGTTITLLNAANQVVGTTTTAADGSFSFANLPAGEYTAVATVPNGYGTTTPSSVPLSVSTSGVSGVNYGLSTASLSGVIFSDANNNGTYDPGTDLVGGGNTVTLTGTDINGNPVNLTTTTNSDGSFNFNGVLASNATGYTVTATPPPGTTPGTATPGTAGGTAGANNDTVTNIVVGAGITATGYQYPVTGTVISGVVYVDANNNGARDPGEVGVGGTTVTLTPQVGPSSTTTTDANGLYTFAGFPAGPYTITETVPTGYGTTTATTINANVPAAGIADANFGLSASSLAGRVYNDLNNSGTFQAGEPGIGGVTVNLRNGANVVVATTTTAADGTYSFVNLPAGTYTIEEVQPAAYNQGANTAGTAGGTPAATDRITAIALPVTTAATGYNFGERGATITGTVYLDNNGNNAIDPGEGGLGGVTIQLFSNNVIIATTTTAPDGTYAFANLPAGAYTVREVRPVGYGSAVPASTAVTLTTAGAAPVNYGLLTSTLSGSAFLDLDNDGMRDAGEAAIPGVTMTLIGTDAGGGSVIRTTVTAADGTYTFAGLVGGTYSIAQAQPAGYLPGKASAGTAGGTTGSNLVVGIGLGPATAAAGYDFGSTGSTISGTVFVDSNRDGVLEPGEPGLGNVPITLTLRDQANQVVATTTSNPDGSYTFANVVSGNYTLVETPPAGYGTSTPTSVPVAVTTAGLAGQNFGVTTSSIAGFAFLDANRNNAYNPGVDIPGANLPVNLTGTDVNGNAVNRTVVVAADGSFIFTGLLAGTYNVATVIYPGVVQQPAIVGTAGGTATGLDNVTGIPLGAGVQATSYLYPGTGVPVSGTVFNDVNRDGMLDNGEAGVPGVTVTLTGVNINTGQPITLTAITDANGQYVFPSAVAQSGTLRVVVPAGYGSDTPTTLTTSVPLAGLPNQNFGLTTARIAGRVFADTDNDGSQQGIDTPLANVVLLLTGTDANGRAVSLATVTAADGSYSFEGLNAGTYTIQEIQPAGYLDGIIVAGTAGGTRGSNQIAGITLAVGQVADSNNFAELVPGSLAGSVYFDANNDGTRDPGEPGIQGVIVTLTGVDDLGNAVNLSTTTRASGNYNFANLRPSGPGGYTITEGQPAGFLQGRNNVGSQGGTLAGDSITGIELDPGILGTNNNFAELVPGTVSGSVYIDANDNRSADPGELGIGGVTVTLTGFDDLGNAVRLTTTTGDNGTYAFNNLRPSGPDGYTVTETHPAGYLPGLGVATSTLSTGVTSGVIVPPGGTAGPVNFAELLPASLSGYVFVDLNNGGAKGISEPGIAGVVLNLTGFDDTGAPVNLTTTTDANGFYSFTNLRPSLSDARFGLLIGYTITEVQPAGYLDGIDTLGTAGGVLSNDAVRAIGLPSGGVGLNYNFGELPPTQVAGFVYDDSNNNGVRDAGEAGIAGVVITLTGADDQGTTVNLSVTTAADGSYAFAGIRPSNGAGYTITETQQPAGFLDGKDTVGTLGGIAGADVFTGVVVPSNGTSLNNNFGEVRPAVLSGSAYVDANGDGVRGADEAGIPGVVVTLSGVNDLNQVVNLTTTTDANGAYSFPDLRPSDVAGYSITETPPAGYQVGRSTPGTAGGTAGPNAVTGVVVAPGGAAGGNNFASLLGSSLAGTAYFDANKDGVRNPGETGLGGITVTLTGTDVNGKPVQTFTVTAADGSYNFANLVPGTYTLTEIPPTNLLPGQTTPGTSGGTAGSGVIATIPLGVGSAGTGYNFGSQGATIAGTTFVDGNGDGVRNPGEGGVGGVTVTLRGEDGTPLATTVSGPDGSYSFGNLPLVSYTIAMTPPAGYSSATSSVAVCCCNEANGVVGQDLALVANAVTPTGVLSGFVYVDADNGGTRSAGDPAMGGVVVTLTGTDSAGNPVSRQTLTAADGLYAFPNLPAGTYSITAGDTPGFAAAATNPGSLGGVAGNQTIGFIPLAANAAGPNYNFGRLAAPLASSISGTVYLDAAKDGRYDAVDFGVAQITVVLAGVDDQGRQVQQATVTDRDGRYAFTNLAPGTYRVYTEAPSRFFRTGEATAGLAGGVARGNTIGQIGLGGGFNSTGNNFGERISPNCRLNDPALLALVRFGPNATSVPAAVIRRVGNIVPGGPVDTYLPTLTALTRAGRPALRGNRTAARANGVAPLVGQAHPGRASAAKVRPALARNR